MWKEPTCTEDGYTTFTCKRCGYEYKGEYVLATGHDYPETPDSVKEPTCTEKGMETYICRNNSEHIMTKEIPALGHKMTITEHVDVQRAAEMSIHVKDAEMHM